MLCLVSSHRVVATSNIVTACADQRVRLLEIHQNSDWEFKRGTSLDVSGGPMPSRFCTDLPFCVLMLIAWVAFGSIAVLGVEHAKLENLQIWYAHYCCEHR